MILSSCHHHSLNNDCRCHCHCCCHCHLLLFATNLCIFHLDLSCLDLSCCLAVCLSGWISLCFLFFLSFFSYFFSLSFYFHFSFFTLFLWTSSSHTHTDTDTHKTYIWIYVPSYDSYILLQKPVSEESYSSDSIISYLI